MQTGAIDAVQSDDDSMAFPTEVTVFGGFSPFASRYSLVVAVLFNQYGLGEIRESEYSKVGVKWSSAGAEGWSMGIAIPLRCRDRVKTAELSIYVSCQACSGVCKGRE